MPRRTPARLHTFAPPSAVLSAVRYCFPCPPRSGSQRASGSSAASEPVRQQRRGSSKRSQLSKALAGEQESYGGSGSESAFSMRYAGSPLRKSTSGGDLGSEVRRCSGQVDGFVGVLCCCRAAMRARALAS